MASGKVAGHAEPSLPVLGARPRVGLQNGIWENPHLAPRGPEA